jgi:putative FmdB family regulatory protein
LPTYEYACTACGHRLEAVQKFTDDALTECPDCGGKLRKVFGAPGIVLKGSGFYKTDTRAADKRSGSEKSSGSNGSDSSGSGSGSGSDTKTDSTTKSSDSGSKTESPKSGSGSDKAATASKPAASTTA